VRTEKPPIMTRIAACRHQGERAVALPDVSAISSPHFIVSWEFHFRSHVLRILECNRPGKQNVVLKMDMLVQIRLKFGQGFVKGLIANASVAGSEVAIAGCPQ